MVLLDPAAMHRRTATFDLPSPRIGSFVEPEAHSPQFFPPPPSSKFNPPRFTLTQSLISRQWLQRTTFLALFSLFSVSVYILLLNGTTNLEPAALPQQMKSPFQAAMKTIAHSHDRPWRPTHKDVLASRPQITLTPEQELAALSSFIISLPDQNILPPSVDPSQPIDPQLIIDFDTRADGAEAELKRLVAATWENYPVVMYTKPSAVTRELRALIDAFNLRPTPIIIDINERPDIDALEPVLQRLTGSSSFPILLVDGSPINVSTSDRVQELSESGTLQILVTEAGAIINGGKRKKGRR
jgi:glutaredoxin